MLLNLVGDFLSFVCLKHVTQIKKRQKLENSFFTKLNLIVAIPRQIEIVNITRQTFL